MSRGNGISNKSLKIFILLCKWTKGGDWGVQQYLKLQLSTENCWLISVSWFIFCFINHKKKHTKLQFVFSFGFSAALPLTYHNLTCQQCLISACINRLSADFNKINLRLAKIVRRIWRKICSFSAFKPKVFNLSASLHAVQQDSHSLFLNRLQPTSKRPVLGPEG